MKLRFRGHLISDAEWLAEVENDPDVARYYVSVYPKTENEISELLKKEFEEGRSKNIVAEVDGEPAGSVGVETREGRHRHIGWLGGVGIAVKRKYWGKGIGTELMKEAIKLAKELGCRKLVLGATEGNERAIKLYEKFGFQIEAYEDEETYIEGSWKKNYIMGLELAPCEPKLESSQLHRTFTFGTQFQRAYGADINVRQLMNRDLDEVNRLQNSSESSKSCYRVPPVAMEETKRWYGEVKSSEEKHCIACFKGDKLLGYLRFRARHLPHSNLRFEEIIVDANKMPSESADVLIRAIKGFRDRYGYRRILAYIPETCASIVKALENHGFRNTGAIKSYYLIEGYYVNLALYGYP